MRLSKNLATTFCGIMIFARCGTAKTINKDSKQANDNKTVSKQDEKQITQDIRALTYIQKVCDNAVYSQNIVGDMTLEVISGDKDITLPGSLHMRRDKVIRLHIFIPIIGSEVGRIEFTPDYVLVIDRIHKQYVKANYNQLDFLRANGLNFYSLQQFFWNQLLVPGKNKIENGDMKQFKADFPNAAKTIVSLDKGDMKYKWGTTPQSGQITSANVTYCTKANGKSTLDWTYGNFKSIGVKMFPADQKFTFKTEATKQKQEATLSFSMSKVTIDSQWETETTISDKYKKMETQSVIDKIVNM